MPEQVEARVSGEFILARDGQRYSDGETCMVSEETLKQHPSVLSRAEDPLEPNSDQSDDLTDLDGVGKATAGILHDADFETVADVRAADPETLANLEGISDSLADDLTDESE